MTHLRNFRLLKKVLFETGKKTRDVEKTVYENYFKNDRKKITQYRKRKVGSFNLENWRLLY